MPHDVRGLRLEVLDDGRFVVVCKCGWRSHPADSAAEAIGDWQNSHVAIAAPEHRFVAVSTVGDGIIEVRCACGWTKSGETQQCLQALERHVSSS